MNGEPVGSITMTVRSVDVESAPFIGVQNSHCLHTGDCHNVGRTKVENLSPFTTTKDAVIAGFDLSRCCLNVYFGPNDVSMRLAGKVLDYLNNVQTTEELQKRIHDSIDLGLDQGRGIGPKTAQYIFEARKRLGRFTSLRQVDDIRWIGIDTFTDIVNSFK